MADVEEVLEKRGSTYGNFYTLSSLSQTLYSIIIAHYTELASKREEKDTRLPPFVQESLRMICHKLARIGNGNPYHIDNWVDIAGYAKLTANILEDLTKAVPPATKPEIVPSTPEEGTDNNPKVANLRDKQTNVSLANPLGEH